MYILHRVNDTPSVADTDTNAQEMHQNSLPLIERIPSLTPMYSPSQTAGRTINKHNRAIVTRVHAFRQINHENERFETRPRPTTHEWRISPREESDNCIGKLDEELYSFSSNE